MKIGQLKYLLTFKYYRVYKVLGSTTTIKIFPTQRRST